MAKTVTLPDGSVMETYALRHTGAELDTAVDALERVQQAADTAAADAASARADAATAQTAANAAQVAAGQAQAIAAGNEAYTKGESCARFASGIWRKTAAGATAGVYGADGSPFEVEIAGATYQAGSGDPSPENIREIGGVGCYDRCVVLTGTEAWAISGADTDRKRFGCNHLAENSVGGVAASLCSHFVASSVSGALQNFSYLVTYATNGYIDCNIPGIETADAFKAYLAAQYAAGTPVTVWYKSTAYATATTYYAGFSATDATGYHGYAVGPMSQPLYDGDTVNVRDGAAAVTRARKRLVLDGTEAWELSGAGTDRKRFGCNYLAENSVGGVAASLCSHFVASSVSGALQNFPYLVTYTTLGYIDCNIPGIETADAFKAYLAEQYAAGTPVTVVYQLAAVESETVPVSAQPVAAQPDKYAPAAAVLALPAAAPQGALTVGYNMDGAAAYNELATALAALGTT